jgi:hypothetical protein
MPYLVETRTSTETIRSILDIHCKDKFTDEEVERAERLDVIGSAFSDRTGGDWCEYRLVFSETEVKAHRVAGY